MKRWLTVSFLWSVGVVCAVVGASKMVVWSQQADPVVFSWLFFKSTAIFLVGVNAAMAAFLILFTANRKRGEGDTTGN